MLSANDTFVLKQIFFSCLSLSNKIETQLHAIQLDFEIFQIYYDYQVGLRSIAIFFLMSKKVLT